MTEDTTQRGPSCGGTYRRLEGAASRIMKSLIKQSMLMNRQLPIHALALIAFVLILSASVQPTDSAALNGPVGKQRQSSRDRGCFYMLQHYKNGEPIKTDEPCLNCTCENSMLMCYLRVCPYVKPAGDRCIIERVPGECCPRITCPDVAPPQENFEQETEPETDAPATTSTTPSSASTGAPQPLLSGTSLFASNTSSELSKPGGCMVNNNFYPEGAQMPSDSSKSCEVCYCIRGSAACVMQDCALEVSGCAPIYAAGGCCPTRYNCSAENAFTTPRPSLMSELSRKSVSQVGKKKFWDLSPTSGFTTLAYEGISSLISSSTTAAPSRPIVLPDFGRASVTVPGPGCRAPNSTRVYADGERVPSKNKCEHCYCMRGELVCAVQECRPPCDGCVPIIDADDQCCPKRYECAAPTQRVPLDNVVLSDQESTPSLLTTPQLPRVTDPESEASPSQGASSPQPPPQQPPVEQTTVAPSSQPPSEIKTTSPSVTLAEQNFTLNDASEQPRDSSATPSSGNLDLATTLVSDAPMPSDDMIVKEGPASKEPEVSVMTTRQTKPPLRPISPKLSTNEDEVASELVPERDLAKSVVKPDGANGAGGNVDGFNLNGEREQDQSDVGKSASRVEAPEGSVPVAPNQSSDLNEVVPPSLTSTPHVVVESSTPLPPPTADIIERTNVAPDTQDSSLKGNNERKSRPLVVPSQIPGEGSCRYNNRLYENGQEVKSRHNCTELCMCINSVVYCDEVDCPRAPENPERCQKITAPGECCPKYICPDETTVSSTSSAPDITTGAPEVDTKSMSTSSSSAPEPASQAFDVTSTTRAPEMDSAESKSSIEPEASTAMPMSSTTELSLTSKLPETSETRDVIASTEGASSTTSAPIEPSSTPATESTQPEVANPQTSTTAAQVIDSTRTEVSSQSPGTEMNLTEMTTSNSASEQTTQSTGEPLATSSPSESTPTSEQPQAPMTTPASSDQSDKTVMDKVNEILSFLPSTTEKPISQPTASDQDLIPKSEAPPATSAAPTIDPSTTISVTVDQAKANNEQTTTQANQASDSNTIVSEPIQPTTSKPTESSDLPVISSTLAEEAHSSTMATSPETISVAPEETRQPAEQPSTSSVPVVDSSSTVSSSTETTTVADQSTTQAESLQPTTSKPTDSSSTGSTPAEEVGTSTVAMPDSGATSGAPAELPSTSAAPIAETSSVVAGAPDEAKALVDQSATQLNPTADSSTAAPVTIQSTSPNAQETNETSSANPVPGEAISASTASPPNTEAAPVAIAESTTSAAPTADPSTAAPGSADRREDMGEPSTSASPAAAEPAADTNTVASESTQPTTSKPTGSNEASSVSSNTSEATTTQAAPSQQSGNEPSGTGGANQATDSSTSASASSPADEFVTSTTASSIQPIVGNYTQPPLAAINASTEPEFSTTQATVVDTSKLSMHESNQTQTLAYDTTTQASVSAPEIDGESKSSIKPEASTAMPSSSTTELPLTSKLPAISDSPLPVAIASTDSAPSTTSTPVESSSTLNADSTQPEAANTQTSTIASDLDLIPKSEAPPTTSAAPTIGPSTTTSDIVDQARINNEQTANQANPTSDSNTIVSEPIKPTKSTPTESSDLPSSSIAPDEAGSSPTVAPNNSMTTPNATEGSSQPAEQPSTSSAPVVDSSSTVSSSSGETKTVEDQSTTQAESVQSTTSKPSESTDSPSSGSTSSDEAGTPSVATSDSEVTSSAPAELPSTSAAPILENSSVITGTPDEAKALVDQSAAQPNPTTDSSTAAPESVQTMSPDAKQTNKASSADPVPSEITSASTAAPSNTEAAPVTIVESSSNSSTAAATSSSTVPEFSTSQATVVDTSRLDMQSGNQSRTVEFDTTTQVSVSTPETNGSESRSSIEPEASTAMPISSTTELPLTSKLPETSETPVVIASTDGASSSTTSTPVETSSTPAAESPQPEVTGTQTSTTAAQVIDSTRTEVSSQSPSSEMYPAEMTTSNPAPEQTTQSTNEQLATSSLNESTPTSEQPQAPSISSTSESLTNMPAGSDQSDKTVMDKVNEILSSLPSTTEKPISQPTASDQDLIPKSEAPPTTSAAPIIDPSTTISVTVDQAKANNEQTVAQANPTSDSNTIVSEPIYPPTTSKPIESNDSLVSSNDSAEGASSSTGAAINTEITSNAPGETSQSAEQPSTSSAPVIDPNSAVSSSSGETTTVADQSTTQAELVQPTTSRPTETSDLPNASTTSYDQASSSTLTTSDSGATSGAPTELPSTSAVPLLETSAVVTGVPDEAKALIDQSAAQSNPTTESSTATPVTIQSTSPAAQQTNEVSSANPVPGEGLSPSTAAPSNIEAAPVTTAETSSTSTAPIADTSSVVTGNPDEAKALVDQSTTQASPTTDPSTTAPESVQSSTPNAQQTNEASSANPVPGGAISAGTASPTNTEAAPVAIAESTTSAAPTVDPSTAAPGSADQREDIGEPSTSASPAAAEPAADTNTVASESTQTTTLKPTELKEVASVSPATSEATTTQAAPPQQSGAEPNVAVGANHVTDSPTSTPAATTASPADEFVTSITALKSVEFKPVNLTTIIPSIRGSEASVTIPWSDISSSSSSQAESSSTTTSSSNQPIVGNYTEPPPVAINASTEPEFSTSQATVVDTSKLGMHSGNQTRTLTYDTTTQVSVGTPETDYEDVAEEPGCEYEGKAYTSAQQIPRAHPCDFCFCFRGDIICLQQTCPPPVPHCFETVVDGFCCPRYECPVHTVRTAQNSTGNGGLTVTPYETHSRLHSHTHGLDSNATQPSRGSASTVKGCFVDNKLYGVGKVIESASGPCLECRCDRSGMMRCNPKECTPEDPLLQQINREVLSSTLSRSQRRRR